MMDHMARVGSFGLAVTACTLLPFHLASAGGTRAAPAVRVVAPGSATGASGIALERDDLPPPQLEVIRHPVRVELPAVPAFDLRAAGERARIPGMLEIEVEGDRHPELRKFVDDATLDSSLGHLGVCNRALVARQFDAAIAACHAATEAWPDNHLAWYAMAGAHLARQQWREARAAAERAVALRADRAMYQMYRGIAIYEIERQRGGGGKRSGDTRRNGELAVPLADKPLAPGDKALAPGDKALASGELALAPGELALAREALVIALRLAPGLWRAHYYLGRVYRDLGDPQRAAQQFTAAIVANPRYRASYIALAEVYRARALHDQALAVALLGTAQLPASETAALWNEAGMAYDAKHAEERANEAFRRVLAIDPDDALATRLLVEIAQRRDERPAREARWECARRREAIECRQRSP
jgi:tetratricopeptide (TPR) repeat protein